MKKLLAIYRENRNGNLKHMVMEYKTKQDFYNDLKGNGYRVVAILTSKNYYDALNNYLNKHHYDVLDLYANDIKI